MRYYFLNYVYPNPPCQLSRWETGAPGENPRLLAERWRTLFTWVRSENRTTLYLAFGTKPQGIREHVSLWNKETWSWWNFCVGKGNKGKISSKHRNWPSPPTPAAKSSTAWTQADNVIQPRPSSRVKTSPKPRLSRALKMLNNYTRI
jgi:hypothetical protein